MCGIAGFYSKDNSDDNGRAARAAWAMRDRGPDGEGIATLGRWTLAHRRLAILDTSQASAQPFRGARGSLLTYNGECWNYRALRDELSDGHEFKTTGDTEVISAALERWGVDALPRMEWMGAFGWTPD